MRLPNADAAIVERAKLEDYLLSSVHPVGRFKAAFFRALGFTTFGWSALADAILSVARTDAATELPPTPFGRRFEVRGTLIGPNGRGAVPGHG